MIVPSLVLAAPTKQEDDWMQNLSNWDDKEWTKNLIEDSDSFTPGTSLKYFFDDNTFEDDSIIDTNEQLFLNPPDSRLISPDNFSRNTELLDEAPSSMIPVENRHPDNPTFSGSSPHAALPLKPVASFPLEPVAILPREPVAMLPRKSIPVSRSTPTQFTAPKSQKNAPSPLIPLLPSTTVREIVEEYCIGLNGQPPIHSYEILVDIGKRKSMPAWRRDRSINHAFHIRKAIYHRLTEMVNDPVSPMSIDQAIDKLEEIRDSLGSIQKLAKFIKINGY